MSNSPVRRSGWLVGV